MALPFLRLLFVCSASGLFIGSVLAQGGCSVPISLVDLEMTQKGEMV
jgi:hypothetical protein